MNVRPGSVAWLMHHEMRLYWRGSNRRFSSNRALIVMLVLLHLLAVPMALVVRHIAPLPPDAGAAMLTVGGAFVLLLMISRGLVMAVQALYARGDVDLLLSSPLPPHSLITVRTAAIAVSLTMEFAILVWPFTNVFLLFGMIGALRAYLLLPAAGVLAISISLVLALLLFRAFGARRTRVIAQVMSALIAIAFTLIVQVPNMLSHGEGRRHDYATGAFTRYTTAAGSEVWRPARIVLDGGLPTIALSAMCALVFWLTTRRLADAFIRASIAATGVGAAGGRDGRPRESSPASSNALRFSGDPRWVLIRKELRLIARDPWLLSQILQQSLVVLPIAILSWRHAGNGPPTAWVTLIFISGNIASALAWLTVTAEDVPDLLAASPTPRSRIVRAKLAAALLPVTPVALLPLAFLWRSHLWYGICVSLCALGAAISCAWLNARDRPAVLRREFRQRLRGNSGRAFLEFLILFGWVGIFFVLVWLGPTS